MEPHLATLDRLATRQRYIVEFGIRTAVSTWALLDAMLHDGTLWSWDIALDLTKVPDRVKRDPRWMPQEGDSATATLPPNIRPDLVLIDSSHEYHHTLRELAIADAWRTPTIALHDWNLPDVRDAVRGFVQRSVYRIEGIDPSEWGLVWLVR
jgi:hypothetical protein